MRAGNLQRRGTLPRLYFLPAIQIEPHGGNRSFDKHFAIAVYHAATDGLLGNCVHLYLSN